MRKNLLLLIMVLVLIPSVALALTISSVESLVSKKELAGMVVTIDFNAGASDGSFIWGYDPATNFSGISDSGWNFEFTQDYTDTSDANWVFSIDDGSNISINSITIDAYGDVTTGAHNFFDILFFDTNEFTPDSDFGFWYIGDGSSYLTTAPTISSGEANYTSFNIPFKWEFSNQVTLEDDPILFYGDLYTTLKIDFNTDPTNSTPYNGYNRDDTPVKKDFAFGVDTDREAAPVPEPSTILLFGLGILGIGAIGRQKS